MQAANAIPQTPGVYFFKDASGTTIYIGKAQNLKMRLSSYFYPDADPKKGAMLREATSIDWQELDSEIEALLKESELIKKYRPKYNVLMRDDKQYFYVGITRDEFPKIFLTHQPFADAQSKNLKIKNKNYIGPFTEGEAIKTALKMLRRIFPYCQCSIESKVRHIRPCQQAEIGRCLGICCLEKKSWPKFYKNFPELKKQYIKNIRAVKKILEGKHRGLLRDMQKEMKILAKKQLYEKAAEIRDQIYALENIFEHRPYLERDDLSWAQKGLEYLAELLKIEGIRRIEAFDVSNIQGKNATGAMVVFSQGQPDKNEYRKFRIKLPQKPNDVAMMKEIIGRRLQHNDWPISEVMVIDGGKAQLNAALSEKLKTQSEKQKFQIIALAKREEELHLPDGRIIKLKDGPPPLLHLLQSIRNEAHRFAISYHKKLRSKF